MATIVSIEQAQAQLRELIGKLAPGEELVLTENHRPIARLVAESGRQRPPRVAGNCQGLVRIVAEDDEHLADFQEYM
jgi:antitoxin (DNA-binding transcriptional repressor) of toxin-antitoxin stability system